ncbi:MAG: hypothetical protein CCU26_17020 [Nitrospira sp. UW-LDO-01]|nr:MAG: hypothetical protein CCU26_17020 [Nitrospira sp. UW-LDO-01]
MTKPIFVATVFKSGTKLLEHLIEGMTGLDILTPDMSAGADYESAKPIVFEPGQFFIWHNVPSEQVKRRIVEAGARPIFLVRNIYDLAVSQYFHFALDVDKEIGHGTRTAEYFARMTVDQGISLVLCGATSKEFHWHGFGYYLHQIQEMLRWSREYPCHIMVYDRLVMDKGREVNCLASFLDARVSPESMKILLDSSSLGAMREARASRGGTGAHFRKGIPGSHGEVLGAHHYDMINFLKFHHAPDLDALCTSLGYGEVVADCRLSCVSVQDVCDG